MIGRTKINCSLMNPLLEQKYKYALMEPVDQVRSQLKSILQTPWYDLAINLSGRVSEDNTFKFKPKFSFGIEVFGMVRSAAVITGKLEPNGEQTIMQLEVRPNHFFLLAFYLVLFIFIFKLFELFTSATESDWILVAALFFFMIFFRSLIHFSMGRLKNRFERTLLIHPEE